MSRILILLAALVLHAVDDDALRRMADVVAPLPVLHEGRLKPFSSVARHATLSISGRSSVRLSADSRLPATAWLLQAVADPESGNARPAVKLRSPEVAQALGLPDRSPNRYYTVTEVVEGFRAHSDEVEKLYRRERKTLGPADAQLIELADNLAAVLHLASPEGLAAVPGPADHRERWSSPALTRMDGGDPAQLAAANGWTDLLAAVRASDEAGVAAAAARIHDAVAPFCAPAKLSAEVSYYRLRPFEFSLTFAIVCLLALGVGLVWRPRWCWWVAMTALTAAFAVQAVGLGYRSWILGRPPVATLYETVLFVSAVAMLFGLVVEAIRRRHDGLFVGAALAVILQLVSYSYADDGDTMGMLVAVLNSNFWLTVHVLTITAGYGACLVAGIAAHVALVARALRPADAERHRGTDRALLGLTLIALFFTLFGTILGGIWADQSWGRFWGWDPKENGALLIVLWQLLMLHLRQAGWAGPLGFAAGLILCNIVVAVAWFGVNLLGVGLHSYGFSSGEQKALIIVTVAETALALGLWLWARMRRPGLPQDEHVVESTPG